MRGRRSLAVAVLMACAPPVVAQAPDAPPAPAGSELTVYLLTMGQGDQIWERFGHNAIGIRDARAGTDIVYNWGLFSFDQPGFLGRFLRGEMMYWMGGFDAAATVAEYRRTNRTVEIQELNLAPSQRLALLQFIRWNALEENRFYRYDYFLDNCSTRVRDALNGVLGGSIELATGDVVTEWTYRDHALRLLAEDRLTTVGVDIGLGRPTDRPLTRWEEMFIPMKVRDYLRDVQVPDETGRMVPLVTAERILFQAERAPERTTPPGLALPLVVAGLAIAGLLAWLHRRSHGGSSGVGRGVTAGIVLWCLVVGVLGLALVYLRTMTQHTFAHDNTNVFIVNPLWFAVAVLAPLAAGHGWRRGVSWLAILAAVLTAAGAVLLFVPGFDQDSVAVALLFAPVNLVVAWILRSRSTTAPAQAIA